MVLWKLPGGLRMPSFDIVSKTDLAEVDNAVQNVLREIDQRYDFKGSNCSLEVKENHILLFADDDLKLKQIHELLQGHLAKRKIDPAVLDYQKIEHAAGQSVRQTVIVRQGIEKDLSKKIVKEVKSEKLKVQISIQGEELRVSGKKRDDLQNVITFVKSLKIDLPLQFVNFRD